MGNMSMPATSGNPRRFATRVKKWSVALAVAAFGVTWGFVSQNVVGMTSATTDATSHAATVPSTDYFGSSGSQTTPITGGSATGSLPVVRSHAS